MEAGTISEWKVQEGKSFSAGDIICLVETDKVGWNASHRIHEEKSTAQHRRLRSMAVNRPSQQGTAPGCVHSYAPTSPSGFVAEHPCDGLVRAITAAEMELRRGAVMFEFGLQLQGP